MIRKFTDIEIVPAILAGGRKSNDALTFIIHKNKNWISKFVMENSGDEQDGKDVLQEGLNVTYHSIMLGKFRGESSIHTFLQKVCRNTWFKTLGKRGREIQLDHVPEWAEPDFPKMDADRKHLIKSVFSRLPKKCEQILVLWSRRWEMADIAEAVGYDNVQSAKNQKAKCLKALRDLKKTDPNIKKLIEEWKNG